MRTLGKLLLTAIALGALVVLLAGPVGADEYPPSQQAPTAGAAPRGAAPTRLPVTGSSSTAPLFWIGLGAFALGGALVVGVRRQHQVRSRRVHV